MTMLAHVLEVADRVTVRPDRAVGVIVAAPTLADRRYHVAMDDGTERRVDWMLLELATPRRPSIGESSFGRPLEWDAFPARSTGTRTPRRGGGRAGTDGP